jgi:8-oxo-dGTP pyrophosphatase MutT (NUDIX family)
MHFANPDPTVNCMVFDERGYVLMVQRAHEPKKGSWCMPGGFIDSGEGDAWVAAARELLEEAGITASGWKVVDAIGDWYNEAAGLDTCNVCVVATADPGQQPRCASDAIDVKWVAPADVAGLLQFDNQQKLWQRWQDGEL